MEKKGAPTNLRIAALDGMRALAILMVLAFHYTVRWAPPHDPAGHFPQGAAFSGISMLDYGWMGVELFFVISGFVILMTLERCDSIVDFARRRVARLWPALIVGALVTTAVVNALGPPDWHVGAIDLAESLTLIEPSLFGRFGAGWGGHWVDGVYWSLAVEIHFYAVAAIVYLVSRKHFFRNFVAIELLVIAIRMVVMPTLHIGMLQFLSPDYAPYFLLGAAGYGIWSGTNERRIAQAGMVIASLTLAVWSIRGIGPTAGHFWPVCLAINASIVALFALFLAGSPLMRLFAAQPLVALGQASYSLYLLHQYIGITLMLRALALGVPFAVALPLVTALLVVLALAMFRLVEQPGKNFVLRHTNGAARACRVHAPWLLYRPA